MKKILIIIGFIFILTGCSPRLEIHDLGVVSALGVDKKNDEYIMSVQVVNPDYIAGNKTDKLPIFTLEATGESINEAYRKLYAKSSQVLYLPHVSIVVIGEELAKDGVYPVVDYLLRNEKIRPIIDILVARHVSASEVLKVLDIGNSIPSRALTSGSQVCEACSTIRMSYNIFDVVNKLTRSGSDLLLNVVTVEGDLEEGMESEEFKKTTPMAQLTIEEFAAFKGDKLVGYLEGEQTKLYNLLMGETRHYDFSMNDDQGNLFSFEVRDVKSNFEPDLKHDKVKVQCEVMGSLMEYTSKERLDNEENIKRLEKQIEEEVKAHLESTLVYIKEDLQADVLLIGDAIHRKHPQKWKTIESTWEKQFSQLDYEVEVKVTISSVGEYMNLKVN